jgi:hypothetical protein
MRAILAVAVLILSLPLVGAAADIFAWDPLRTYTTCQPVELPAGTPVRYRVAVQRESGPPSPEVLVWEGTETQVNLDELVPKAAGHYFISVTAHVEGVAEPIAAGGLDYTRQAPTPPKRAKPARRE